MAGRRVEDGLWEIHKETISRLYIDGDKTLKEVISSMTTDHSFKKTKAQYERIFKKWGWTKNTTADRWKFVGHRIKKRTAGGKASELRINVVLLAEAKLKKEVARYEYGTALVLASPRTPPGITISTPPDSTDDNMFSSYPAPVSRPFPFEELVVLAQDTPFRSFKVFTDKIYHSDATLDTMPLINLYRVHELARSSEEVYLDMPNSLQRWLDKLTMFMYTEESLEPFESFYRYLHPIAWVPPLHTDALAQSPFKLSSDMTRRDNQLKWLKMAVSFMSNNQAEKSLVFAFVELCQDKSNQRLLCKLLDEELLSVRAFAEKLLTPAVAVGDMTLVTLLLDAGASPDATGLPGEFSECSPLQCSILQRKREFVKVLMDRGANPNVFYTLYHVIPHPVARMLIMAMNNMDLAVLTGDNAIVSEVMLPRASFGHIHPTATLSSIYFAVKHNDISMLHFLVRRNPYLVQDIKHGSNRLLELAAYHGYLESIDTLIEYGADMRKTNSQGIGSALAAAAYGGHFEAAQHLLSLGSNVDGVLDSVQFDQIFRCVHTCPTEDWALHRGAFHRRHDVLPLCHGLSPLSLACLGNNEDIVLLLLQHKANVEQPSVVNHKIRMPSAVQIAVWKGTESVMNVLLQAGADPDEPPSHLPRQCCKSHDCFEFIRSLDDRTAIQLAMERGEPEITRLLLRYGATVHTAGTNGMSDFFAAVKGQNPMIEELFFGPVFSFDDMDTALQACIEYDRLDLAQRILEALVVPRTPGPICAAVHRSNLILVKNLLDRTTVHENFEAIAAAGLAVAAQVCDVESIRLFLQFNNEGYTRVAEEVHSVKRIDESFEDVLNLPKGTTATEELAKVVTLGAGGGFERQATAAELLLGFFTH